MSGSRDDVEDGMKGSDRPSLYVTWMEEYQDIDARWSLSLIK